MPNFRRFLSRRWVFAGVIVVIALPMVHPFVRQSIFGPTIDGIPWCVWEDEARYQSDPSPPPQTWLNQLMRKFGFGRHNAVVDARSAVAFPVQLYLAEDRNANVRRFALQTLYMNLPAHKVEVTPSLRRHLEDADPECRLIASLAVWKAAKDERVVAVLLALLRENDRHVRDGAVDAFEGMARDEPELFDPFAKLTEHVDIDVRYRVLAAMGRFGKRGVPSLRKALQDPNKDIRESAIYPTTLLGKDGMELMPILQSLEADPVPEIRRRVGFALNEMDPKKFAMPAK